MTAEQIKMSVTEENVGRQIISAPASNRDKAAASLDEVKADCAKCLARDLCDSNFHLSASGLVISDGSVEIRVACLEDQLKERLQFENAQETPRHIAVYDTGIRTQDPLSRGLYRLFTGNKGPVTVNEGTLDFHLPPRQGHWEWEKIRCRVAGKTYTV